MVIVMLTRPIISWSMIRFHQLNISCHIFFQNCMKIESLTGREGLKREGMLITFVLVSKAPIQAQMVGLRFERWGNCTLIFILTKSSLLEVQKLPNGEVWYKGSNFAQNSKWSESLQNIHVHSSCPHKPNTTLMGSNICRMSDISFSIHFSKHAKFCWLYNSYDCTVMMWQGLDLHMAGDVLVMIWHADRASSVPDTWVNGMLIGQA
jgi:hypothetical protein